MVFAAQQDLPVDRLQFFRQKILSIHNTKKSFRHKKPLDNDHILCECMAKTLPVQQHLTVQHTVHYESINYDHIQYIRHDKKVFSVDI